MSPGSEILYDDAHMISSTKSDCIDFTSVLWQWSRVDFISPVAVADKLLLYRAVARRCLSGLTLKQLADESVSFLYIYMTGAGR